MDAEIKETLWATADSLRSDIDAAEYKHLVLGLVFLNYISDAFDERQRDPKAAASEPRQGAPQHPKMGWHPLYWLDKEMDISKTRWST